ncbi:unnamed protein product [Orchesella dallaii]|uniref:Uncharacterized protein n=1 Tax=Orchesella dallaii TaxID=48710 RepID=A0ABP1RTY8_9HEXA
MLMYFRSFEVFHICGPGYFLARIVSFVCGKSQPLATAIDAFREHSSGIQVNIRALLFPTGA